MDVMKTLEAFLSTGGRRLKRIFNPILYLNIDNVNRMVEEFLEKYNINPDEISEEDILKGLKISEEEIKNIENKPWNRLRKNREKTIKSIVNKLSFPEYKKFYWMCLKTLDSCMEANFYRVFLYRGSFYKVLKKILDSSVEHPENYDVFSFEKLKKFFRKFNYEISGYEAIIIPIYQIFKPIKFNFKGIWVKTLGFVVIREYETKVYYLKGYEDLIETILKTIERRLRKKGYLDAAACLSTSNFFAIAYDL